MKKQAVRTDRAPVPVGPYSQAVRTGELVFTSGQIALDPATGQMKQESIEAETEQVFANLAAVLEAAGSSMDKVVKVLVFLTDMNDFSRMNQVYARHFSEPFPARSCVQVSALPKGARVEIELVAAC
ncbi:MAG: RidA family protein [candidate division WOR-3 bacterium]